jgi:hypothetical protein
MSNTEKSQNLAESVPSDSKSSDNDVVDVFTFENSPQVNIQPKLMILEDKSMPDLNDENTSIVVIAFNSGGNQD